tara:strand:+ start:15759 stop:17399 length:1641 start_codon:yes stop_codon:yes gene_type:complete
MSNCIEKISHSCGSSDGLQVWADENGEYNGYCFACGSYVADPYKGELAPNFVERTKKDIKEQVAEIDGDWLARSIDERGLRAESLDYFDCRVGVSEQDGRTPKIAAIPIKRKGELVSYKMRLLDTKKMYSLGNGKEADLFGLDKALLTGAKRLFITEGEFDAVALFQTLKDQAGEKYKHFNPAVVSAPNGAGSAKRDILRHIDVIRKTFKDVVLCFDMDDAGKLAATEVGSVFPEAMVADLPAKDCNECLIKGLSKQLKVAVMFNAVKPKNCKIIYGSELKEAAQKETPMGLSFPWQSLTNLTRGERKGEVYYWGSGVKMGKSELLNALAVHKILNHGEKVFMAKPEEANAKTYKLLVGKAAQRIFHDPSIPFDHKAFEEAEPLIGNNVAMLDLYQHMDWDTVKRDIIFAASEGYTTVYLDPITNFTNMVGSAEANELLVRMAAEASAMAMDHGLTIHFFCHLLAPAREKKPHERGGKILSSQFAGSRSMMRSCNYMFGLEGNKDPELEDEERNQRQIVLLEDREHGSTGKVNLFWDKQTGAFEEI